MHEIKPMNVRNGLKAVCVIARHLDKLAPYIVAFQNTKDRKVKLGLIAKAVQEFVEENTESVVSFMAFALDIPTQEAGELKFPFVLEALPQIFVINDFEKLMQAAIKFGLIDPKQGFKLFFMRK